MPSQSEHYLWLDLARGLAAVCIMLYHMKEFIPYSSMLQGSFLAVDLFFLMSGFVIAHSYQERLISGQVSSAKFLYQRFLRLYPLYLMASMVGGSYFALKMLMGVPGAPTGSEISAALPSSLLLVPALGSDQWGFGMFPFAPSAWSLSLELWFSIIFALVFMRLSTKLLIAIMAVSSALLVHQMTQFGTADLGWGLANWNGGAARFWTSFTFGVLIWRNRIYLSSMVRAPALAALFITFTFVALPEKNLIFQLVWIFVVFPVFLAAAISSGPRGIMKKISNHMGRLSYAIYIFHAPVILLTLGTLKAIHIDAAANPYRIGLVLVVAVFVVSGFATYALDEPFRAWARRRRTQADATVAPKFS